MDLLMISASSECRQQHLEWRGKRLAVFCSFVFLFVCSLVKFKWRIVVEVEARNAEPRPPMRRCA